MNGPIIAVEVSKASRLGISAMFAIGLALIAMLELEDGLRMLAISAALVLAVVYWQFGPGHSFELSGVMLTEIEGRRRSVVDLDNVSSVTFNWVPKGSSRLVVTDASGACISIAVSAFSEKLRRSLGVVLRSRVSLATMDPRAIRCLFLTSQFDQKG
jgi:hypothetical protein